MKTCIQHLSAVRLTVAVARATRRDWSGRERAYGLTPFVGSGVIVTKTNMRHPEAGRI